MGSCDGYNTKHGIWRYDSWVRCLTRWEGKQNICPLTKKPLTKRDLGRLGMVDFHEPNAYYSISWCIHSFSFFQVILDFDNIEEYRWDWSSFFIARLIHPLIFVCCRSRIVNLWDALVVTKCFRHFPFRGTHAAHFYRNQEEKRLSKALRSQVIFIYDKNVIWTINLWIHYESPL